MQKSITTLILIVMFSTFTNAQHKYNNYQKDWEKVEQFELKNLPKSALSQVETIYKKAKKENNNSQIIKTLLYKSKFSLILEENAQLKVIEQLNAEIASNDFPVKNILESMLANLYWQYFQQNRWKFYNRTHTDEKVDTEDFRTWDLQTIFKETQKHYQNSLNNGLQLQQVYIGYYNDILIQSNGSKKLRPTLYDFLAHRALDFYKTDERNLQQPTYKFEIDDSVFLENNAIFIKQLITAKDSLSQQLHALKIYKNLTLFHLKDEQPNALIDLTLERLDFVKSNTVLNNKEAVYLTTLQQLYKQYKTQEIGTEIAYKIALANSQKANNYQPKTNEDNRWENKKALAICEEAITAFPNSSGAKKCENLKYQILNKSLALKTENFIPKNTLSKILVTYKNVDSLYFKAIRFSKKEEKKFNEIYNDSAKIAFLKKLKVTRIWQAKLRNENDYQQHTSEVVIPKLIQGNYLIYASTNNTFDKDITFALGFVQVTDIALIENIISGNYTYQVVDRNNGKPIQGAKIQLKNYDTNKRYNKPIETSLITNEKGEASFTPDERYSNVVATVIYGNDKAVFGDYYFYKGYKPTYDTKTHSRIFLFTDRSIYRPGQTVYFKGIAISQKTNKSEVITNEKVTLTLKDVNYQDVTTIKVVTNDFGSFSGEFVLPNTGITGNFSISALGNSGFFNRTMNGSINFSVEEYKRPKFETSFSPITDTYRINDSITVKGSATAYAGSSISDAKVVYRVYRTAQYPRWYWYYRPQISSESQEITHGETTTDAQGNFNITFKALADLSISKASQPTFSYNITADVTDINGETRSTETTVNVGYHTLEISASLPEKIDKKLNKQPIKLTSNNLNGEFVPTKGIIKIYKLQAPKNVLRERPWETPDYHTYSKETFKKLFPHDAYNNEDKQINWQKGNLVFSATVNTEKSKEIILKNIRKWISGSYVLEFVCSDNIGQEVKDKQFFTLYSNDDKKVADNQLFIIKTNKETYKPNENIKVTLGSASKDVTVTVKIEKNFSVVETKTIHLSNEIKSFYIPVKEKDRGGFAIHYQFVNYNSYQNGTLLINVPYPKHELEIETTTFRDKLQPGQNETWSFKIKGSKSDKVVAEVLASMYDASLDQFKGHQWGISPINYRYYYQQNRNNASHSFGNSSFIVRNLNNHYSYFPTQNYDDLNWFGLSFGNIKWTNSSYVRNLKQTRETWDKVVTGNVSDESGPLSGVSVIIKGTSYGTETDFDGNYSIKVKNGDVLVFSFVGMESEEVKVSSSQLVNMTLQSNNQLDEVVVTGYGTAKSQKLELRSINGKMAGIQLEAEENATFADSPEASHIIRIRGNSSLNDSNALYVLNGKIISYDEFLKIKEQEITKISILKPEQAISIYGEKAKNGVIVITTIPKLDNIKARKNLQETAFFYPHLTTDKENNVSFNFTVPESLTRWKLQLLAHTKDLQTATKQLTTITQKELMVLPNPPRFFREGDTIVFASKIANLSDKNLDGIAQLQLFDALTNKPIDYKLGNSDNSKIFAIEAKGNINVSWQLTIPDDVQAVKYRIVAKADDFSDGEENALPVLSNRMLVTETLPMWLRSGQTKTFILDKLKNNTSTSLKNYNLSLEVTSNPAWYAIQALPYLMEYPYECAEQTFSRYYANALGSHITNSNPRIQEVFNQWKNSDALLSNLEKNPELKSLIIQETPWLREAQSETEQKKRIALLFDLNKMRNELQTSLRKLEQMQMSNGGFPWFKGSNYPNRYITQYIAEGLGHLNKLNVASSTVEKSILPKAIRFLDNEILNDYHELEKQATRICESAKTKTEGAKKEAEFWKQNHTRYMQIHYLYMRSFFTDVSIPESTKKAVDYYTDQAYKYWQDNNLYTKGLVSLIAHRNNNKTIADDIMASLKENAIVNEELGMYWKDNTSSWFWYQAPIETQALLIEAFSEITNDTKTVDELKVWLLKNKQTNRWSTTKSTIEAVYALLLQGTNWLSNEELIDVTIGKIKIDPMHMEDTNVEAGTSYFKTSWKGNKIKPEMATVTINKKMDGVAWGALYWQYFEDLDKITFAETPLKLKKKLFLKKNTDKGEVLKAVTPTTNLQLGDLVRVRIELRVDRLMEFVHMKDMRAAGFEPVNVLSQYKWQDGLGYYESTKDASTNFFFDYLPKGVYVFEYNLRVNNKGDLSNGITTIQSMYAPEFCSHSEGVRVKID